MNRIVLLASTLSILSAACSAPTSAGGARPEHATAAKPRRSAQAEREAREELPPRLTKRAPGDFVVRRFSGSFRKEPLTMTERIVSTDADQIVLEVSFEEGKKRSLFRVRETAPETGRGEVLSASRVDGKGEKPDLAGYEALLAKTALAADQNEGELGDGDVELPVGGTSLPCKERRFRVRIGKRAGVLKTIESRAFPWGDVGAELMTDDGKVLYKAVVVEAGHADAPSRALAESTIEE